jgi:hypothetical protein
MAEDNIERWLGNKEEAKKIMDILLIYLDLFDSMTVSFSYLNT